MSLRTGTVLVAGSANLDFVVRAPHVPAPGETVLGKPHFAPKAKSIIYLFQSGGPSHLDLFDPKPELTKRDGQKIDIDGEAASGRRLPREQAISLAERVACNNDRACVRLCGFISGLRMSHAACGDRI